MKAEVKAYGRENDNDEEFWRQIQDRNNAISD